MLVLVLFNVYKILDFFFLFLLFLLIHFNVDANLQVAACRENYYSCSEYKNIAFFGQMSSLILVVFQGGSQSSEILVSYDM